MPTLKLQHYVIDEEKFRGALHARRTELGMTMLQLAQHAGVASATVHKLESGKLSVHLDKFLRVVDALGIPLADLISYKGSAQTTPPDPAALKIAALLRQGDQAGILDLIAERLREPHAGPETAGKRPTRRRRSS